MLRLSSYTAALSTLGPAYCTSPLSITIGFVALFGILSLGTLGGALGALGAFEALGEGITFALVPRLPKRAFGERSIPNVVSTIRCALPQCVVFK